MGRANRTQAGESRGRVRSLRFRSTYDRWIRQGVYAQTTEAQRHLDAMRQRTLDTSQQTEHDYLYECLSILDAKSSALLTYNSIIIAAVTIVLSTDSAAAVWVYVLSFVLVGLSSLLCLTVVWIIWTETEQYERAGDMCPELLRVRNHRTVRYRVAWVLSTSSTALLMVAAVFTFLLAD